MARDPVFVVQKHNASRLHYDFRLEARGVLVSWAVPKGPSMDPGQRRLAMMVEDHPMSWGDFEGVIGEGYGKGEVIIWDEGTYENLRDEPLTKGLELGRLTIRLHGKKLRGDWSLRRMTRGEENSWLLQKKADELADRKIDILEQRPESVRTGRTIEDLAG